MKTNVADTSIEAYYRRIIGAHERNQVEQVVHYIITHPGCTRRAIAAYFRKHDPSNPLSQEARVAARVNAALHRKIAGCSLIVESAVAQRDPVTHEIAYPLYPTNYAKQQRLFEEAA